MKHRLVFLLAAFLLLSGCAPASTPTATPLLLSLPSITPLPTETATLTPVTETPTETLLPPVSQAPPMLPSATPGTMQLFFPTVIPAEGAEYRPPLYPAPWAISPHDHFYFAAPIAAQYPGEPEWDYRYGGTYFGPDVVHTGIDLPAPRGTNVLAAGPGTVVWAGVGLFSGSPYNTKDPYGLAVAIRHDFGYQGQQLYTIYAHMDDVLVVVGQWLNTGDVLGKVGSTGMTTGPHLHFEVRLDKNDFFFTRNPELWLSPPQGDGVLAGRVMNASGVPLKSQLAIMKNLETGSLYNAYSYGGSPANSDAYYDENVVISNLPAGVYELKIPYGAQNRITHIQILPGQVTYFSFYGFSGVDFSLPADPAAVAP